MKLYRNWFTMGILMGIIFIFLGISPASAGPPMWVGTPPIDIGDDFEANKVASAQAVNDKLDALEAAINVMRTCQGNDEADKMLRVGTLCVDKYEASLYKLENWDATTNSVDVDDQPVDPSSLNATQFPKTGTIAYAARSVEDRMPATNITWFQAQAACATAGKRLLTNAEWQLAAGGTGAANCQISGSIVNTGSNTDCYSIWGIFDMAGNASEWVADWMQGKRDPHKHTMKNDTETYGPQNELSSPVWHSSPTFGEDGIYAINYAQPGYETFPPALIRGGEAGQDERAGIFAINASYGPGFSGSATGFRCARPLAVPPLKFNVNP